MHRAGHNFWNAMFLSTESAIVSPSNTPELKKIYSRLPKGQEHFISKHPGCPRGDCQHRN